jgi:asparagine synthase (glutamine-hydrolysing)
LRNITRLDFESYLPEQILVKVDRSSMLASLEVRAPFLDRALIEFAFCRLPDHLRATSQARKILPRALAARLLPPGMDLTRKQGFSMPLQAWFKGTWGQRVEAILRDAEPNLFRRAAVDRLIAQQSQGYSHTQRLFALATFELWRREYGIRCDVG